MTTALYHCCLPLGAEVVLPKEDLGVFKVPVSEEVRAEFFRRYDAACVAYTKAKGIQVASIKADEFKVNGGPSVYVIAAGNVDAAYFPKGWPETEEEYAISTGMAIRTRDALNAHYYAAERETFSVYAGVNDAIAAGKRFVIVEDLS